MGMSSTPISPLRWQLQKFSAVSVFFMTVTPEATSGLGVSQKPSKYFFSERTFF